MRLFFDLDLQRFVLGPNTTQELLSISVKRSPNALVEVQFLRGVTPQELSAGATGIFEVKESGKYDANAIFRQSSWVKTGTGEDTIYSFTLDVQTAAGDTLLGAEDPVTVTATAATDLLNATGHGLVAGDIVQFSTDTTLPAPLLGNRDYFVIAGGLTANAFKVSLTLGGTAVDITDTGTGTHKFRKIGDDLASVNLMAAMQYVADGNTVESQTFVFVYQNDVIRDGDSGPDAEPEDVIVAVRSGKVAIVNGTDTGTIVFGSAFTAGSTVAVVATVAKPIGGENIFVAVEIGGTATEEVGFDYFLSAAVPAAGYKLSYIATAV